VGEGLFVGERSMTVHRIEIEEEVHDECQSGGESGPIGERLPSRAPPHGAGRGPEHKGDEVREGEAYRRARLVVPLVTFVLETDLEIMDKDQE
jgi:hypothetical protein